MGITIRKWFVQIRVAVKFLFKFKQKGGENMFYVISWVGVLKGAYGSRLRCENMNFYS